jgi:signal transduction histidine kinase
LHNELISKDIALIMKLTIDSEVTGYIILGYKSSGSSYSEKDCQLMSIIADEVAISLQNAIRFKQIQNFNVSLQEKIDQATRQLIRANTKLKNLDETKDDFISMASHQLRTPLTSVKGYVSMVLEGDAGEINNDQKKMLTQAFDSSQRMVYLISDLLNISRLQTGKFIIEKTESNLPKIIEEEIYLLRESAKARGLRFIYHKPKDFPTLNLDEIKIRQVIMNYLDNAIYYSKSGGTITITLEEKSKNIELRVTDTGIGVPKDVVHHLFTKFYRADNAKKARPDGTGLGLFMAKKVIIAQGGSLIFESVENKGSTFGFTLPKN